MHHLLGAEHNRLEQVQINAWETMIKVQNKRLAKGIGVLLLSCYESNIPYILSLGKNDQGLE